jgi:hypothetical protein
MARSRQARADHFLQRNHIGIQVAQHVGDAKGHRPPVEPAAAVDVVGDDANLGGL